MRPPPNEPAIETLRRVVGALESERESVLLTLPTFDAVVDYAALWAEYDTECLSGIEDSIFERADPAPLRAFVARHNLGWDLSWIDRIPADAER